MIPNQAASKARFRDTMTTLELEDKSRAATAEYRRSVFVSGNAAKALRTLEGQGLVGTEVAAAASERLVRAQAQQAISQTKMEAAAAAVDEQRAIAATKAGLRASRQWPHDRPGRHPGSGRRGGCHTTAGIRAPKAAVLN